MMLLMCVYGSTDMEKERYCCRQCLYLLEINIVVSGYRARVVIYAFVSHIRLYYYSKSLIILSNGVLAIFKARIPKIPTQNTIHGLI